jgi:hypothetical protein
VSVSGMEALNGILWQECSLLEDLLFAVETEQWVLATGRARWQGLAASRVCAVGDRLRDAEVLRAMEADALAARLGLGPAPSLCELAERAGEPWRTILLDQRELLRAAAAELTTGPSTPVARGG